MVTIGATGHVHCLRHPVGLKAGQATAPIPLTGTVTFLDGTTPMQTVPVDATGHASFTTSTLGPGSARHHRRLQRRPQLRGQPLEHGQSGHRQQPPRPDRRLATAVWLPLAAHHAGPHLQQGPRSRFRPEPRQLSNRPAGTMAETIRTTDRRPGCRLRSRGADGHPLASDAVEHPPVVSAYCQRFLLRRAHRRFGGKARRGWARPSWCEPRGSHRLAHAGRVRVRKALPAPNSGTPGSLRPSPRCAGRFGTIEHLDIIASPANALSSRTARVRCARRHCSDSQRQSRRCSSTVSLDRATHSNAPITWPEPSTFLSIRLLFSLRFHLICPKVHDIFVFMTTRMLIDGGWPSRRRLFLRVGGAGARPVFARQAGGRAGQPGGVRHRQELRDEGGGGQDGRANLGGAGQMSGGDLRQARFSLVRGLEPADARRGPRAFARGSSITRSTSSSSRRSPAAGRRSSNWPGRSGTGSGTDWAYR